MPSCMAAARTKIWMVDFDVPLTTTRRIKVMRQYACANNRFLHNKKYALIAGAAVPFLALRQSF